MKVVPQSDPSGGDITAPTSPDVKQNTLRNEEEGENNPSPNEAVVVSERKVPDNDGAAMKVPRPSGIFNVKLKNTGEVVSGYLFELMNTRSIPAKKPVCDIDLSDLTTGDVKVLAEGMLYFLRQELTVEDAAEKCLECYPCMRELSECVGNFNEMHVNFLKDKLGDKQKLAKAKLFFAALLSIGDMVTDIVMIVEYFQTRSLWGYAWASLGSLLTNLTIQALISFGQNRAKPWQRS